MNRLQKNATGVYRPATPGVPGRAAFCTTTPLYTTQVSYASGFAPLTMDELVRRMTYGGSSYMLYGDGSNSNVYIQTLGSQATHNTYVWAYLQQCYPAIPGVPATPARIDYVGSMGWDASARSIEPVPANGYFRATIPTPASAVAFGLSGRVFGGAIASLSHAVVVRPGGAVLLEQGAEVEAIASGAGRWELRRRDGLVEYYLNDTLVHTSSTPLSGEAYAVGMLYSLADMIDSPSIAEVADVRMSAYLSLSPLRVLAATEVAPDLTAALVLPALRMSATLADKPVYGLASLTLPPVRLVASTAAGVAQARLLAPAATVSARLGDFEAMPSGAALTMPLPTILTKDHTIGRASAELKAPLVAVLGSDSQLQAYARVPLNLTVAIYMAEPWMPADTLDGSTTSFARTDMYLQTATVLVGASHAEAETWADVSLSTTLVGASYGVAATWAEVQQAYDLLLEEWGYARTAADISQHEPLQYLVNARTAAVGRAEGLDFDGFARVGRVTYGYAPHGVYVLEDGGGGDDGAPIPAMVNFGAMDFGSLRGKRLDLAYVGVYTDGNAYLEVQGDDGSRLTYRLTGTSDVKRARMAKGIRARSWNCKLTVEDSTFAEVESFEISAGATPRVTGRRR